MPLCFIAVLASTVYFLHTYRWVFRVGSPLGIARGSRVNLTAAGPDPTPTLNFKRSKTRSDNNIQASLSESCEMAAECGLWLDP